MEAICPGVFCHSLHSTALASLYSLSLGTPFMLKSMQAIFSQDFFQPGKSWRMGDVLSYRLRTTMYLALSSACSRPASTAILCPFCSYPLSPHPRKLSLSKMNAPAPVRIQVQIQTSLSSRPCSQLPMAASSPAGRRPGYKA